MFRYNPAANYQPNGDRYFQILSGEDLYKETIVVSAMENYTFPARFLNILLIILWDKCMLGIDFGLIGIKLLCVYGKHS